MSPIAVAELDNKIATILEEMESTCDHTVLVIHNIRGHKFRSCECLRERFELDEMPGVRV